MIMRYVNGWFIIFAGFTAWWHIEYLIKPWDNASFFLVPVILMTCLAWCIWAVCYVHWTEHRRDLERRTDAWWLDYAREHRWVHLYKTDGYFVKDPSRHVETHVIACVNCYQRRRVWANANLGNIAWGCPQVPTWYRIRALGRVPYWDVNERPPWVRM